jgi:phosphoribosyl 1,2-cyclic phosphate phosphodiesterase
LKITFLGTGTSQGIPLIACSCNVCQSHDKRDKRLRSSVLISANDHNFVIDSGPDFRQQMLRENVRKLDAVIFTHEHKDHINGLDDLRAFNFIHDRHIDVYGNQNVHDAIKREFAYIFQNPDYPGIPKINLHLVENNSFVINEFRFHPIEVMHYKLPVFAYRILDFTYITDANFISEKEKEKIKGSKIIVLNALRRNKHISHFTFDEAIELLNELKPEKAYLTHISHQLGKHEEVEKELPDYIRLAYDGLKIEIS